MNTMSEFRRRALVAELADIDKKIKDGDQSVATAAQEDKLRDELISAGFDPDIELSDLSYSTAVADSYTQLPVKKQRKSKTVSDHAPWEDDFPISSGHSYSSQKKFEFGGKGGYSRCAHSHPIFTYPDSDGAVLSIQGGSCYSPQGEYDVEIGFDGGMKMPDKITPWDKTRFLRYPIPDQRVPKDKEEFEKLVDWTIDQMRAGKKVHCGCIGGHGRTGVFLAVLGFRLNGDVTIAKRIRKEYCAKAIESKEQIDWLEKHYGIERVEPRKHHSHASTKYEKTKVSGLSFGGGKSGKKERLPDTIAPLAGRSVWGF